MTRLAAITFAALLAATPALAQAPAPAPAPGAAPAAQATPKDVPMARLMSDGAQVRGGLGDRIILQLGKFVFLCRLADDKPATCDLIP
jgi:hypothetical protein